MKSACLDEDSVLLFVEGRMGGNARGEVERHVDECVECRRLVAALAGGSDLDEATAKAPPTGPSLPRLLDERYAVLREVGSGPHGRVLAARDRATGDTLSVKWLHHALSEKPGAPEAVYEATLRAHAGGG